jgi:membrane protein YdbS with pleckstrin-like domain
MKKLLFLLVFWLVFAFYMALCAIPLAVIAWDMNPNSWHISLRIIYAVYFFWQLMMAFDALSKELKNMASREGK